MIAPLPPNETQRLAALRQYDVLDTPPEPAFDDLTLLTSHICQTPIALFTLLDEKRQWFKSKVGTEVAETPRDIAFCAHAILNVHEVMQVRDASLDPRFCDNPLVTSEPHIRFYAGVPLVTPDGQALGSLCVIDRQPRTLTAGELAALRTLGRHVVAQLELRRHTSELAREVVEHQRTKALLQQHFDELAASKQEADRLLALGEKSRHALLSVIEDEKRTGEKLRLLETCVSRLTDIVLITEADPIDDSGPCILFVNDAFERRTGFSREEAIGKTPRMLQGPKTQRDALDRIRAALKAWQPVREELINYTKSGEEFWLELDIVPVADAKGWFTHWVAIERDITARKQAEKELREIEKALRRKLESEETLRHQAVAGDKAKREFLAVMSHEIRTPMNGILGFTEMLNHDVALSAESRGYVETIRGSGEALLHILDDVLDFSRIEAGRLKIEKVAVSPSALLDEITALFALQIREHGLDFQLSVAGDVPLLVMADPGRIRQILVNLVGNALKFTEQGTIRLGVRRSDARLDFFVHDSGTGIAANKIEEIFEPFTQADSSTARHHGGAGLGLTISRRLAGLMGGELNLRSEPGHGTEISILLPLEPAEATATATVPPRPALAAPPPSFTVLVVEDDPVNLKLIVLMLRRLGYNPLTARNGVEAVRIYQETRPACILMDVQMAEMDGIEATRQIRQMERDADAPPAFISALTANILPEDRARCFKAGMDLFLNKPIKTQAIADMLLEAARSHA